MSAIFNDRQSTFNQNRPPLCIFSYTLGPVSQNIFHDPIAILVSHTMQEFVFFFFICLICFFLSCFCYASVNDLSFTSFHFHVLFPLILTDLPTSWPPTHLSYFVYTNSLFSPSHFPFLIRLSTHIIFQYSSLVPSQNDKYIISFPE
jgi:hypothetical protein